MTSSGLRFGSKWLCRTLDSQLLEVHASGSETLTRGMNELVFCSTLREHLPGAEQLSRQVARDFSSLKRYFRSFLFILSCIPLEKWLLLYVLAKSFQFFPQRPEFRHEERITTDLFTATELPAESVTYRAKGTWRTV